MPHPSKETLELMRPGMERSRIYQEIGMAAGDKFLPGFTFQRMNQVIKSYRQPWRHLHNLNHPIAMLDVLRKLSLSFLQPHEVQAIRFMIIYHDVVYRIGKEHGWNERTSMKFAKHHLEKAGISKLIIDMTLCGIEATIDHSLEGVPEAWRIPIAIFLDIDLFIGLGETYEEFLERTEQVKAEYTSPLSPIRYTEEQFAAGRKAWARKMLVKERIFHSALFARYEKAVQRNLRQFAES